MGQDSKIRTLTKSNNTEKRYYDIFQHDLPSSVVVNVEWTKSGDYFEKFSMYDSGYSIVTTLGETTLIKDL